MVGTAEIGSCFGNNWMKRRVDLIINALQMLVKCWQVACEEPRDDGDLKSFRLHVLLKDEHLLMRCI